MVFNSIERRNGRDAYLWRGLVVQDGFDLLQHSGSEFRDDLERLEVVEHLLGLRCAKDDGAGLRLPRDPRKGKLGSVAAELCGCSS